MCPNNVSQIKSPTCIVFELYNKTGFLNIQNACLVAILDPITTSMTPNEILRVLKCVLIIYFKAKSPPCIVIVVIQNSCQAAILYPITKSMTLDERVLKNVLITYFEPKALHA
jgi:hypothetical protein